MEYGTSARVGGGAEIENHARIIAATNRDLEAMMREVQFLRDLYDRIAFEVIDVPPLRGREGDVEVLARHFLNQFAREIPAFKGKALSADAIALLRGYPFPGNVRELKNIIERAATRPERRAASVSATTSSATTSRNTPRRNAKWARSRGATS